METPETQPAVDITSHRTIVLEWVEAFRALELQDGDFPVEPFLTACRQVTNIFDILGSTAFAAPRNDMRGNIEKIRRVHQANPGAHSHLFKTLLAEKVANQSKVDSSATVGLLWLTRGLEFTHAFIDQLRIGAANLKTSELLKVAYQNTLSAYHGFAVRQLIKLAFRAAPKRHKLIHQLFEGVPEEVWLAQLLEWARIFAPMLQSIKQFYTDNGLEDKRKA
eukprot:gnl/Trimastix_PCT/2420.p2 GENE.gnl/Trimastix_PCT/2420~~gnl/Trimastix_PCT/2420.p2  ORF type:complete len:231 (+),score=68.08 gnl/Trimastix_PCT/2420:33-695(+)